MQNLSKNVVQLLGTLGAEVERRDLAAGKVMARVSLATSETKELPTGVEKFTTWHSIVAFGDIAEGLCKLSKGDKVHIEGQIKYRTYETKTGEKKYQTDIQVTSFTKDTGSRRNANNRYWYFELNELCGERKYTIKKVFKGTDQEREAYMHELASEWYGHPPEKTDYGYEYDCGEVIISLGEFREIPQHHYSVLKDYI